MSKMILSLDGGGIRGAASAQFLSHVEEALQSGTDPKSIRDCVDFYAGTSTGSIIALALATTDMPVSRISELYDYDTAKIIFTKNTGWFEIDGLNAPKYEASGKTDVLKDNFKAATISDVPAGKHVLAVGYAIERRTPMVIKSTKAEFLDLLSSQVADASSAAPTYFPTKELEIPPENDEYWLVDGGVIANNPTMCAIVEARRAWSDVSMDQLRVLSIGTGFLTRKINGPDSQKWGGLQWMTKGHILDLLSDERIVAYQAITILKRGNYIRVNASLKPHPPELPKAPDDAMDDISKTNIKRLKELGDFWFDKYGQATVELLKGTYQGPSLDRIDADSAVPLTRG